MIWRSPSWTVLMILAAVFASAATAQAVTFNLVPAGNPGNDADTTGYGAVSYRYMTGKYEITAGLYCEFLNAMAKTTDTYYLYNSTMYSSSYGCKIRQIGSSGNYTYLVDADGDGVEDADWVDRPVNYVTWGDAARFANWLHNGQPTGTQGLSTTEDGAYYLNGATTNDALLAVTREADWKWAITSEDEWYKAAYHKNDGVTGNYYDYPTSSDSTPSNVLGDPNDPGNNATFHSGGYTIGSPCYRTEVGDHENSDSPYGTFDQGGNVWEWNESIHNDSDRGLRGGSFISHSWNLLASYRTSYIPIGNDVDLGFRVACLLLPGDANVDGYVDLADLGTLLTFYNQSFTDDAWTKGDFDGNGLVDLADLGSLLTFYNQNVWGGGGGGGLDAAAIQLLAAHGVTVTPEPSTLVLFVGGRIGRSAGLRLEETEVDL